MSLTKTQQKNEKVLQEVRPKTNETETSKFYPKQDLFNREKTVIKNGREDKIPADWRKFSLSGKEVILFKGKNISQEDYDLIKSQGKEALEFFIDQNK